MSGRRNHRRVKRKWSYFEVYVLDRRVSRTQILRRYFHFVGALMSGRSPQQILPWAEIADHLKVVAQSVHSVAISSCSGVAGLRAKADGSPQRH